MQAGTSLLWDCLLSGHLDCELLDIRVNLRELMPSVIKSKAM